MAPPDEQHPGAGAAHLEQAHLEQRLSTGTRLRVVIEGAPDAAKLADRAFAAAAQAISHKQGQHEEEVPSFGKIVGRSEPMTSLFRMLHRIQKSDATVLVLGENGTGKELVARAIHESSRRAKKAFVATNCSAFNDNLLESELFGHRKGAFTGAIADKPGLFEVADGGTFFMDEVGDMSPALQVKLLRVLQEGMFMPVGGTEHKRVDVRIVAATNRDLASMVRDGSFREDLYYRLHVVSLRVPPLRERSDDIPLLVSHFLRRLAERDGREKVLTQGALARLRQHVWPGNVRELENEMERLWVLSGEDAVIDEDLLSPSIQRATGTPSGLPSGGPLGGGSSTAQRGGAPASAEEAIGGTLPEAVEALERRMIASALSRSKGNKTRAAETLGISRRNLIRKVQAYDLDKKKK